MAIYQFATNVFTNNIYIYGTNRLTKRDGYNGVATEYYIPVQQRAAWCTVNNPLLISRAKIDKALENGWINQQEYDETISYIPIPTEEQQLKMNEVAAMESET